MAKETMIDYYTCEQAFARLFEYLDRELAPDEEALVRGHLGICESCAHHFQFEAGLLGMIREKCRSAPLPVGLRQRIGQLLESL